MKYGRYCWRAVFLFHQFCKILFTFSIDMECSVDVFVGNTTVIDPEIYQLWVDGNSAHEAADVLQKRGILQQWGANMDLLMSDVLDHYRTFHMLEKTLHTPLKLTATGEWTFQIDGDTQQLLIEKYYQLDDVVVREVLGKKLSSRHRKDLDEVSEKTAISLRSCRRQFDNVKRIHKLVEELPGHIVNNIQHNFLLSTELSRKYAAVVFIAVNRFETTKRKLQYLNFSDFYHCAHQMIEHWSSTSCHATSMRNQSETETEIETDLDVDRGFLHDLREVRILLDKEKELKHLVCSQLKGRLTDKIYSDMESSFKTHSRSLVLLAGNLNRSRELRSLFVDLVERCVEPLRQARWTSRDLRLFLDYYTPAGVQLFKSDSATALVWERYMKVISSCLVKIYHN